MLVERRGTRATVGLGLVVGLAAAALLQASAAGAQERVLPTALANGQLEAADDDGRPEGWHFVRRPESGQEVSLTGDDPFEGSFSAVLDATAANNEFTNLMQAIDATPYQGQRVRFRAAVRTAELEPQSRVQLWFRVDLESGMGAFDNMQDRPIRTASWETFDVVLDVAEDAARVNVGIFLIGPAKAWIDAATVEAVDPETPVTSSLASAFAEAAEAPPQPFWTPWLLLALLGMLLCTVGLMGAEAPSPAAGLTGGPPPAGPGGLQRFALRFALAYWLLYSLPMPFSSVLPFLQPLFQAYGALSDAVVRWAGAAVFGIENQMVAPNGSGDTTYAYVSLFVNFVLATLLAAASLLLDRRGTKHGETQDLLRSYLRYVLAATMLSYGLAKVGWIQNQFPPLEGPRLDRTYGDSSPMGLLWSFMGASRPYTFFAGMGEVTGGLLLLFRRTTLLGAMVTFGVMLNVVLLNFSYDVPVKQYSAHLAFAAILILIPDWRRFARLLLLQQASGAPSRVRAFSAARFAWPRRIAKVALVLMIGVVPVVLHVGRNVDYLQERPADTSSDDSLLMNRGFRWINEVPFNR